MFLLYEMINTDNYNFLYHYYIYHIIVRHRE